MAAVAVAFDGTRVDDADAVGNWDILDTTNKAALNNDFFIQGTGAISIKATTSLGGSEYEAAATVDFTSPKRVVLFKNLITTLGVLLDRGQNDPGSDQLITGGLNNRVGSDQDNYNLYYIHGKDTYPPAGGWIVTAIDPNLTEWIDEVWGTPVITAVDYYAIQAMFSDTVRDDNIVIDAVDYLTSGTGLTLTGGDGGSTPGGFQDFIDEDEGDIDNRWGGVISKEGVLYSAVTLTVGNLTATGFQDSNKIVIFVAGLHDAGHLGLITGIGNASSDIDLANCQLVGTGKSGVKHYFDNISSVDAANNEIDITAHGLDTGDPVLYSDEGGSNPVGGLTDATIYWVKKITDDAIALSDSRWAAQKGDVRLVLADASSFIEGTEIAGDGDGGNTGTGIVVAVNSNDVTVMTLTGAWVAGNGVDNNIPYSSDDTTISSIESTNGGIGLTDGASRENHSLTRQPDTRFDFTVTISMTLASAANFVVGGPITGDGDGGNDGVGIVRAISGNVVEVQTLSGSWVATNGVDNADPYSADETTISSFVVSGNSDVTGGTFLQCRRVTLYTGVDISPVIVGIGKILLNGGTLTGAKIAEQTTEEGEALIDPALTLAGIVETEFALAANEEGHAIRMVTTTGSPFTSDANKFTGYWSPADNGWKFHTITGIDDSAEVITTNAAHGFIDGEAVYYNDEGGTDTIGLTDLAKYYVNFITTTTLSLHTTRASAIADTARVNLTDGSGGETHSLYSSRAAIFNDSGGSITISVTNQGDPPSIRNGAGASTTVEATVPVTINTVDKNNDPVANVRCALYETLTDLEIINEDSNGSGVATENYNYPGSDVDIYWRTREFPVAGTQYKSKSGVGVIENIGFTVTVVMEIQT